MREIPRTICIYYDPERDMYARQTNKNKMGHKEFTWKKQEQLPPRFLPKIAMLNLSEYDFAISGMGRKRKSIHHAGYTAYYLYHETWLKKGYEE